MFFKYTPPVRKQVAGLSCLFLLICIAISNVGSAQDVQAAPQDPAHVLLSASDPQSSLKSHSFLQATPTATPVLDPISTDGSEEDCSGTGCADTFSAVAAMKASVPHPEIQNPQWKILVLIYTSIDFAFSNDYGQHHIVTSMTPGELDLAKSAASRFVNVDIPALTSGNMVPLLTIREIHEPLLTLDPFCGYFPNRWNTMADLEPFFDSVIVIWDSTGKDLITGEQEKDLTACDGLAQPNGLGQTYAAVPIRTVASNERYIFKHEWGHSILDYFHAAGLTTMEAVDVHIRYFNIGKTNFVHCLTGTSYILEFLDKDDNPVANSQYNNDSGYSHDYYSGTTAKYNDPNQCLGISPAAWAQGGPVTKPDTSNPNLPLNGGFEEGNSLPAWWAKELAASSTSSFVWDPTSYHSGSRSIQIANHDNNDAGWIQTVYVQPNSDYRLSGWIKTQLVAHSQDPVDAGANLSIMGGDEHTDGLFGDNHWTYVSLLFNTQSRTQVDVAAQLGMDSGATTGTAWFDDLKLELLSPPVCHTLTKGMNPSGNVSVDPLPNCNNGTQYIHGTVVKLTANPPAGYTFSHWSEDVTGSTSPAYVVMIDNKSVTVNFRQSGANTTGVFRPSNGALYLKNRNNTGFADIQINYGLGGDYPVVGDWDGDGTATIGIYRDGSFYLRNSNTIGFADMVFPFGVPGDQPVAGDWDNDGVDTIGVYRNGLFLLRNSNDAGTPEMTFALGLSGDVGITGDWNGDGIDTTGIFRPSNGALYLKNTNVTGFADIQINYGLPGDQPLTGDWNNDGIDTIGIYRNGQFMLRNTNTIGFADMVFDLGIPGDMPIAGNWDGMP